MRLAVIGGTYFRLITRTLSGKCEQAVCILATEEKMKYQSCWVLARSQTVVESLWWHIVGTSLAGSSVDCHVSITFQPFLPGLVCCSFVVSSACPTPAQCCSALNSISMTSSVIFICCMLYCRSQIYSMQWCCFSTMFGVLFSFSF